METKYKVRSSLLVIALALGGFIFPILFIFAIILGLELLPDLFSPHVEQKLPPVARYNTITADDPEWKDAFFGLCESPAEEDFLTAMMSAFNFTPDKGLLRAENLTLALQVKVPPYRLDFLANNWLVVEIDGATYHSSPEAVERDRVRDRFLEESGYNVLRIAAKLVFNSPDEAVRMVRSAITAGRQTKMRTTNRDVARSQEFSFGRAVNGLFDELASANSHGEMECAIKTAMFIPIQIFVNEKMVFNAAVLHALTQLKIESGTKDEICRNLKNILELKRASKNYVLNLSDIPAPQIHQDLKINESIKRAYGDLIEERSEYFATLRKTMWKDHRIPEIVSKKLDETGCSPTIRDIVQQECALAKIVAFGPVIEAMKISSEEWKKAEEASAVTLS